VNQKCLITSIIHRRAIKKLTVIVNKDSDLENPNSFLTLGRPNRMAVSSNGYLPNLIVPNSP
jgi:hypothetical protein